MAHNIMGLCWLDITDIKAYLAKDKKVFWWNRIKKRKMQFATFPLDGFYLQFKNCVYLMGKMVAVMGYGE